MPSFADIATKKLEDIERPPLAPIGDYIFKVNKAPTMREMDTVKDGVSTHWEVWDFPCQAVQALETVDPAELAAFGSPTGIFTRNSFMFNTGDPAAFARTEYDLRQFLNETLKIDSDISLGEAIPAALGRQFMGELGLRENNKKPGEFFSELKKTAAID